jgi:hypothetical protein
MREVAEQNLTRTCPPQAEREDYYPEVIYKIMTEQLAGVNFVCMILFS